MSKKTIESIISARALLSNQARSDTPLTREEARIFVAGTDPFYVDMGLHALIDEAVQLHKRPAAKKLWKEITAILKQKVDANLGPAFVLKRYAETSPILDAAKWARLQAGRRPAHSRPSVVEQPQTPAPVASAKPKKAKKVVKAVPKAKSEEKREKPPRLGLQDLGFVMRAPDLAHAA